jgi:Uma2 family endonuclease
VEDAMSEPVPERRITVAEFLKWDDGTDTSYELIDGRPVARYARSGSPRAVVAMAPPAPRHGRIAGNACLEIERALEGRPPCGAVVEGGIRVADDKYYVADVAATCAPISEEGFVREPFLVVEIVSDSDRGARVLAKVQDYIILPSVQEIWLIDGRERRVQQWRRGGEDRWIVTLPLTGQATFDSPTLGGAIELDRLYRNTGLEAAEGGEHALAAPGGGP